MSVGEMISVATLAVLVVLVVRGIRSHGHGDGSGGDMLDGARDTRTGGGDSGGGDGGD